MPKKIHAKRKYQQVEPPVNDWLDRLARFNLHFGRFLRDTSGIFLIALALMSLLAIWDATQGILLTPWADFLVTWFGWGSYILIIAIGYCGFALLRHHADGTKWGRVFALELASLLTLGLFAVISGFSLIAAESGNFGGRLGWGIAYLFKLIAGPVWGTLLLLLLWLLAMMSGFGFGAAPSRM